jgi:hypothetical protein
MKTNDAYMYIYRENVLLNCDHNSLTKTI